jgi:hypothetical protein
MPDTNGQSRKGFASMSAERHREVSARGGRNSQKSRKRNTSE